MNPRTSHRPDDYRRVWFEKPVLRAVYEDIYRRLAQRLAAGPTLEIGGGSGNMAAFTQDVVSSDITPAPWLDLACDAQKLPFRDGAWANIVMVDVLHHIERPVRFFEEASRVLMPCGRIVFCEPAITPLSGIFYRFAHPEPVAMRADPLADLPLDPRRTPFDANQAIPTLLLGRDRARFQARFPELCIGEVERFSAVVYPLSGGFRRWSAMPSRAVAPMLKWEWKLRALYGRVSGFRLMAWIEKNNATQTLERVL